MKALTVLSLVFLLAANSAFGQTSNATLGGTVSDASGALIPGVSITATNIATGIVTTVISNEAGAYEFVSDDEDHLDSLALTHRDGLRILDPLPPYVLTNKTAASARRDTFNLSKASER